MKKILITGGSGFIGTNLINHLNKKKFSILNIDKLSYSSTAEKFKSLKNRKNYKFKKLDLMNSKNLDVQINSFKPDYIIHLAAESHVDRSIDDPYKFFKNNIETTLSLYSSLINYIKVKKVKVIHISTDEVFGSVIKKPFIEMDQYNPSSPYSASKASSDMIAKAWAKTFNIKLCILRISNNYGPYQFIEKFIPLSIMKIINKQKIPLYGKGVNIREWIHVEDTCIAIEKILMKFKESDFNIGSSYISKNITISKKILKLFNKNIKQNIIFTKDRPAHDVKYALNSKKFEDTYKWKAKIDINTGLKKTLNWYIGNKDWIKNAEKKYNYKRLGNK